MVEMLKHYLPQLSFTTSLDTAFYFEPLRGTHKLQTHKELYG